MGYPLNIEVPYGIVVVRPAPHLPWYIKGLVYPSLILQVPSSNQLPPDYPLDTLANMSNTQKDQCRSLKNVVNSKLNPSFKLRRQMSPSKRSIVTLSAPQSECSTLVDFPIDFVEEEDEYPDEEDNSFLSADNAAWSRRRGTQVSAVRNQSLCKTPERRATAEMLDADDRAWASSKQNKSLPTRILHALAGQ
ncbi:hypothetical protein BDY19DRAFT_69467 [Irpex rosettiformis]|uniref:Uncharacterized protein n=1 Tax=Irpex rosettiformis TaxID=378272 RepID=A0ACB8UND6_9APHY|nr:hypothetical protein BDY19DRAFT_69467 [Irpex rosettiformis]